jgi:hypothetical protein
MKIIQTGLSILLLLPIILKSENIENQALSPSLNSWDKRFLNIGLSEWHVADQETHKAVHKIINDSSVIVIHTTKEIAGAIQIPITNTKCIYLDPGFIRALKRKNRPVSWQHFKNNRYASLEDSLHHSEAKAILLHEHAHIKNKDTKWCFLRPLMRLCGLGKLCKQRLKMEFDADSAVINSGDIEALVGFESTMIKAHYYNQRHSIIDNTHPEPLARAMRATEKINERLGHWA